MARPNIRWKSNKKPLPSSHCLISTVCLLVVLVQLHGKCISLKPPQTLLAAPSKVSRKKVCLISVCSFNKFITHSCGISSKWQNSQGGNKHFMMMKEPGTARLCAISFQYEHDLRRQLFTCFEGKIIVHIKV